MSVRVVEQWKTMYEAVPGNEGEAYCYPAAVRPVAVTFERKRDPSQRRWRVRYLKPDGSTHSEDWVSAYNFRRFFFPSEPEAWEGLLEMARVQSAHFRQRVAAAEREIAELEQQVRFKRWKEEQSA